MKIIELNCITFSYRAISALSGISADFEKGDAYALIGPNGSGKSTLLKLLNGILFPEKGEYFFDGQQIHAEKLKKKEFAGIFHQRIGFLLQNSDTQLFCSNVYEEIAFGPRQIGLQDSEIEKRVDDCLNLLEIRKLKHREPYHLSEGEKKKVALASVLAMNPEVLTLDEPMNGLDPKTKRFLRELLIELRKAGKTILCSTHDFAYVEGVFERALVFSEDHAVIRDGRFEEIVEDKEFLHYHNII